MAGELRRAIAGLWKGCPDAQDADESEQLIADDRMLVNSRQVYWF